MAFCDSSNISHSLFVLGCHTTAELSPPEPEKNGLGNGTQSKGACSSGLSVSVTFWHGCVAGTWKIGRVVHRVGAVARQLLGSGEGAEVGAHRGRAGVQRCGGSARAG